MIAVLRPRRNFCLGSLCSLSTTHIPSSRPLAFPSHGGRSALSSTATRFVDGRTPGSKARLAATWLAPNPNQIISEDVVRMLPRLSFPTHSQLRKAAFLVTPALAKWFDAGSPFLQDAMNHMYQDLPSNERHAPVHSLVAVVDKLPGLKTNSELSREEGVSHGLSRVSGFEGLALYLASASQEKEFVQIEDGSTPSAVIRFFFPQVNSSKSSLDIVELPPANTLFVNGQETSIFQDTWISTQSNTHGPQLSKSGATELLHYLNFLIPSRSFNSKFHVETLTESREVLSSMGNIIRQLKANDSTSAIPASSELEKKVPQYLKRHSRKGILRIFALIWPSHLKRSPEKVLNPSGNELGDSETRAFSDAIFSGAHLHRVTSGGGGWGKKIGLLSLDPAYDFESARNTDFIDSLSFQPTLESFQAVGEIAKPGDHVQFFAALIPEETEAAHASKEGKLGMDTSTWNDEQNIMLTSLPAADGDFIFQPAQNIDNQKVIFLPNQFGMASERGMCMRRYERVEGGDSQDATSRHPDGRGGWIRVARSRLDIPFSTWNAQT